MLGNRLRKIRIDRLMSVSDLAEIINKSKSTISRYENNRVAKLDLDLIEKMAIALHTSSAYLLGMTDDSDYTSSLKASDLFADDGITNVIVKDDEMAPKIPKGACVQVRELKDDEEMTAGSFYYVEFNNKKCFRMAVDDSVEGVSLMPLNMSERRIAFDEDYVTFLGKAVSMEVFL